MLRISTQGMLHIPYFPRYACVFHGERHRIDLMTQWWSLPVEKEKGKGKIYIDGRECVTVPPLVTCNVFSFLNRDLLQPQDSIHFARFVTNSQTHIKTTHRACFIEGGDILFFKDGKDLRHAAVYLGSGIFLSKMDQGGVFAAPFSSLRSYVNPRSLEVWTPTSTKSQSFSLD